MGVTSSTRLVSWWCASRAGWYSVDVFDVDRKRNAADDDLSGCSCQPTWWLNMSRMTYRWKQVHLDSPLSNVEIPGPDLVGGDGEQLRRGRRPDG